MQIILVGFPTRHILNAGSPATMIGAVSGVTSIVEALARHRHEEDRLIAFVPTSHKPQTLNATQVMGIQDQIQVMDHADIIEALAGRTDVVIQTLDLALWRGLHLRWLCGSPPWPVVGMNHSISAWESYQEILLNLLGPMMPYDALICTSRAAATALSSLFDTLEDRLGISARPQLLHAPLGIDSDQFAQVEKTAARHALKLPQDKVIFLYLGRIEARYKIDLKALLSAFSSLPAEAHGYLVIAGATPSDDVGLMPLKLRCMELGISDRVRWLPNIPHEQRRLTYSAADIFVSAVDSLQESFGLALLEAMASGLPVIASDWDGYRDIVDDGRTGILIPTVLSGGIDEISKTLALEETYYLHWQLGQSTIIDIARLAAAMQALAEDTEVRTEMGRAARSRAVAHFGWKTATRRYRMIWQQLVDGASNAAAPPPESPYWYDHRQVFADYPTAHLTAQTLVTRVEPVETRSSLFAPPPFLKRSRLLELVPLLNEPLQVEAIPGDVNDNLRHIAYLIKQGLVTIIPTV